MIRLPFSKPPIHGVLVCGGNATRFAATKRVSPPYPKHLENIAGWTLLERAVNSMVKYTGITEITITLNNQMQDEYLAEINRIAAYYNRVKFSYLVSSPVESDGIPLSQEMIWKKELLC